MEADVRVSPAKVMVLLITIVLVLVLMAASDRNSVLGRLSLSSRVISRIPSNLDSDCNEGGIGNVVNTRLRIELRRREDVPEVKKECLPCHVVDNVKTLVLFVGYPRSCHSLVGSLLDAHPNMVIAHEYNLLGKWGSMDKSAQTKKQVFNELFRWSQQQSNTIRHVTQGQSKLPRYSYGVPNQWQGSYKDRITVIGDKRGGLTSRLLTSSGEMNEGSIETIAKVQNTLGIPIKFIHVVRNPYDNIATMSLRRTRLRDTEGQKAHLHNTTIVDAIAGRYFRRLVGGVERVKQLPYPMLDVHCESFIKNPVEELERLCKYLGVPCPRDYITDSTSIVHSKPSLTRQYVDWSDKTKKFVAAELKKHEFLAHYRFEA